MAEPDSTFEMQRRDTITMEEHPTSIGGHGSLARERISYTVALPQNCTFLIKAVVNLIPHLLHDGKPQSIHAHDFRGFREDF